MSYIITEGFNYAVPTFPLPTTVAANCCVWLDAADATTMSFSGSNVTQWRDKSGSNNHGTGVGTAKPYYLNGTMNFVHSTQSCFTLPNGALPAGNASCGYFVVFTNSDASVGGAAVIGGGQPDGTWDGYEMFSKYSPVTQKMYWGLWSTAIDYYYPTLNANTIFSTQYNNNGGGANGIGTMVVNGTIVGTGTGWGPLTRTTNNNYVGSQYRGTAYAHSGTISEVLVFSNALTTAQQQQIEGYLAWKWGFVSALPTTHPYYAANTTKGLPVKYTPTLVKEALPFNPGQVSGCTLWLDGQDTSVMQLSGTTVNQWNDKSGNKNNTNAVSGTPIYTQNAINGSSAILLNGSSSFTGPAANTGTALSCFFVGTMANTTASAGRAVSVGSSDSSSLTGAVVIGRNLLTAGIWSYRNNTQLSQASLTYTTPFIACTIFDGTNNTLYFNGAAGTAISATGSFNYTQYSIGIGSAMAWVGYIGEVVMWNRALTTAERTLLEAYFAQKWSLSTSVGQNNTQALKPVVPFWYSGRQTDRYEIAASPAPTSVTMTGTLSALTFTCSLVPSATLYTFSLYVNTVANTSTGTLVQTASSSTNSITFNGSFLTTNYYYAKVSTKNISGSLGLLTGPAVAPFIPTSLSAPLITWFKGDAGLTASSWTNYGTNGGSATFTNASLTNIYGLPAVSFSSGGYAAFTQNFTGQPRGVFFVIKYTTPFSTGTYPCLLGGSTATSRFGVPIATDATIVNKVSITVVCQQITFPVWGGPFTLDPTSSSPIVVAVFNSASSTANNVAYYNGTSLPMSTYYNYTASGYFTGSESTYLNSPTPVGLSLPLTYCEALCYDGDMSSSDVAKVVNYLRSKWGTG